MDSLRVHKPINYCKMIIGNPFILRTPLLFGEILTYYYYYGIQFSVSCVNSHGSLYVSIYVKVILPAPPSVNIRVH